MRLFINNRGTSAMMGLVRPWEEDFAKAPKQEQFHGAGGVEGS